ncbi:hypothetical protein LINPERHAP2_LOCUS34534 [Linum perenne]
MKIPNLIQTHEIQFLRFRNLLIMLLHSKFSQLHKIFVMYVLYWLPRGVGCQLSRC